MQLIRTLWDTAVNNNLNLVRFFAFAVSPEYALQTSPGQYSEAIFRGLDYALEQLRSRGLKVRAAVHIALMQDTASCPPWVCILSFAAHHPVAHNGMESAHTRRYTTNTVFHRETASQHCLKASCAEETSSASNVRLRRPFWPSPTTGKQWEGRTNM